MSIRIDVFTIFPEYVDAPMQLSLVGKARESGLVDLRVHDLRRSLGSWMASTGASTTVTMKALGHRSVTTAMIYQQLAADPVREAAQRAVTAMLDAAKGRVIQLPNKGRKARRGGKKSA